MHKLSFTILIQMSWFCYHKLCKRMTLSMVSGTVDIETMWRALGKEKVQALAIFHAFTGADNAGKFSVI